MNCVRCGQEIYLPHWNSNICGNCADDLRADEDAAIEGAKVEAEAMNRQAYEDEQRRDEADYIIQFHP